MYTYFPRRVKLRFFRYQASWTYMRKSEKFKPKFARPETMFKKSEYKHVIKGKVFGLTLSNGKQLQRDTYE